MEDDDLNRLLHEAQRRMTATDPTAAVEYLCAADDPVLVMKTFRDLVNQLYWKQKDLPTALQIGLAGIQYGMTFAAGRGSGEILSDLRSVAKTLAYNLASFTWPGWDEPGIALNETVIAVGLDMAKLNLRLAESLNKGDLPMARGHWMLGAQLIASGKLEQARDQFAKSAYFAEKAGSEAEVWLARGFIALSFLIGLSENEAFEGKLLDILSRLRDMENGPEYARQIQTARGVFIQT